MKMETIAIYSLSKHDFFDTIFALKLRLSMEISKLKDFFHGLTK